MAIIGISGKAGAGKDLVGKIIKSLIVNPNADYEWIEKFHINSDWKIVKFADKLKDIVCLLIGCTREQLEDREFKEKELGEEWFKTIWWIKSNHSNLESFNSKEEAKSFLPYWQENYKQEVYIASEDIMLTYRNILQLLGTEAGRKIIHPDIWVNATMADYKSLKEQSDGFNHNKLSNGVEVLWKSDYKFEPWHFPNWIITDVRFPNELKAIKDRNGINIRVNRPHYDTSMKALVNAHESETALDNAEFDYVIDNDSTIEDLIVKVKEILVKEKII